MRTKTIGAVLSLGVLLALMPAGAGATGTSEAKAVSKKTGLKMLKRLHLDARHSPRATTKRPRRGSLPAPRGQIAKTWNGECAINHIPNYVNGVYTPYTWISFQSGGTWYGYYVYNRYAWSFGLPTQPRLCEVYLGTQNEWYRWTSSGWYWFADVNCDFYTCRSVRSR